jgi:hypothetical protein
MDDDDNVECRIDGDESGKLISIPMDKVGILAKYLEKQNGIWILNFKKKLCYYMKKSKISKSSREFWKEVS